MRRHLLFATSLLATSLAYFLLAASPFNWTGGDEWGALDHASQGIVWCSNCKRICLVYNWLAYQIWPGTLWGFRIFGALTLWAGGLALYSIGGRLFPRQSFLALTWAVFYVVFLTRDYVKLHPVFTATYACSAAVALWAIALYVEAWSRRSTAWLLAALIVNGLAVWSYETSIPLLLLPPVVLAIAAPQEGPRSLIRWSGVWYGVLALGALRYAMPSFEGGGIAYQHMLSPLPVSRWPHAFVQQFLQHFGAFRDVSLGGLATQWVAGIATLAASAPLLVVACREAAVSSARAADRPRLLAVVALGLVSLLAGVAPYAVLFGGLPGRAHYYSTPGAVLMIVGTLALAASFGGRRWRASVVGVLWVGLVVTSTVSSAQFRNTFWWDRQAALFRQLTDLVPETRPETLIVLTSSPAHPAFMNPTSFYFAVRYLYGRGTAGIADGTEQLVLEVEYSPGEIHIVPKSWASGMAIADARYPVDRLIFISDSRDAGLSIAKSLPAGLGWGRVEEQYQPDALIIHTPGARSSRRILDLAGPPSPAPSPRQLARSE